MKSVTIIGAGNVGTTLGILLSRNGFEIQEIFSARRSSAEKTRDIIGSGSVIGNLQNLSAADICLVTTSDNAIPLVAAELRTSPVIQPGTIVFHCSGATPSSVFSNLTERGAAIASVHPVKTFTAPTRDADTFPGTWCGIEGDSVAVDFLKPLFERLGARTFVIDQSEKALYHAALVFVCNYLFSLIEVGLQCYEAAGVPREVASRVIEPILHATVENALKLGPGKALTGPIARGDDAVVARQLSALHKLNPEYEQLYKDLGVIATRLSLEKGVARPEKIADIRKLLGYA